MESNKAIHEMTRTKPSISCSIVWLRGSYCCIGTNSVDEWLDFTHTEAGKRQQILELMQRKLNGGGEPWQPPGERFSTAFRS